LFLEFYERTLGWALRHSATVMLALLGAIGLTVILFAIVPKGFFPQQDTGRLTGTIQADQSISFQAMEKKVAQLMAIIQADPAVESIVGFIGSGSGGGPASSTNTGSVYVALKPLTHRNVSADQVINRLRHKLTSIPGALLYLQAVQDIHAGGRASAAQYQYTLQGDSPEELNKWTPKLVAALQKSKVLTDVNSDLQQAGLETFVQIDRDTASRLGITPYQIDNTLYDAFGQRQVSTIYSAINQYHVVMEVAPRYWQDPSSLKGIFVSTSGGNPSGTQTSALPSGTVAETASAISSASATTTSAPSEINTARDASINAIAATGHGGTSAGSPVATRVETMVPLVAFAHLKHGHTPLSVNHSGLFVASTISFNLKPGASLGDATAEIERAVHEIGLPADIHGSAQGAAAIFQASLANEPLLILAALAAVYIVLGVLYESYIHPITILSTLPSAGVGALLALLLFKTDFSIIALIGVILLIGIVKKNAIMMVDFAIVARRDEGMSARDAIFQACILRFRPIMMTTAAAILGAVPLALSFGEGGEIRRPLGISIVGGLIVSQMLTLYTTPVLYLLLDRVQEMFTGRSRRSLPPRAAPNPAE
jgi:multidrug efflux pump